MTNEFPSVSPEANSSAETRRPRVVIATPSRFPDVLAEITRAQPLTMLAVAFIAGTILAWRRETAAPDKIVPRHPAGAGLNATSRIWFGRIGTLTGSDALITESFRT